MKKTEQEKILYKLAISKLKIPVGLKKYIHKNAKLLLKQKCYVNALELWHGKLLLRTFAFNHDECFVEVCRRLEGSNRVLLNDIENRPMSGRYVWFSGKTWDTDWYKKKGIYSGSSAYWRFDEYDDLFDVKEWIEKLEVPYCCYLHELNHSKLSFFDYMCLYRKYPKIELLVKAGWSNLVRYARYFHWQEKSFRKIFGISDQWKPYMQELDFKYIQFIKKNMNLNVQEVRVLYHCKTRRFNNISNYMNPKMLHYLSNLALDNRFDLIDIYDDYLRFAERLGYNMKFSKILYPIDIVKSHDTLVNRFENIESNKLKRGIKNQGKKLAKYKYSNEKYCIFPATKPNELINESKVLNHCVRTYAEKVANGETGILFIRQTENSEQPFYTLELKGKQVIQVRGKSNAACLPEVSEFVKQWEEKFHLKGV